MTTKQLNELDQSERIQLLVDAVKDYAIFLLDADGKVATWNTGAQLFKGYAAEEIVGRHFSVFYTDEDRAEGLPARALQTAAAEGRFEAEGWRIRKDGSRFWTHAIIDPIHDDQGQLLGFAKVTRDVTERRRIQEQIEQAREALGQAQKMEAIGRLTGGVAHDFNNLLTIIRASADFLRRPDISDERRVRYVDAIASTAERATLLTGQLLAFARRQPLEPEVFDVGGRLCGLEQMVRTTVGSSIAFALHLPEVAQFVRADPSQFETAILNMVINSRDAMPRGGEIRITCRGVESVPQVRGHASATGEFVALQVIDTGVGMPPETRVRIFEPFFTTKEVDKGTGLGLSQVYGFAKQSGGEIDVGSEVGVGTTFTLYLPRVAPPLASAGSPEPAEVCAIAESRRILVVEDNESVGEFATGLLRELGHEVTLAGDAGAALEILADRANDFDVVFSDVVMPGMNGIELCQQVSARWPELEIILTSGYSHIIVQEGTHGFRLLKKPYSIDGLQALLGQVSQPSSGHVSP